MQQGVVTKSRTSPRNVLKGILPTADATWGVAPTNLANATDGNPSTSTGVGTKTVNGVVGYITLNRGTGNTYPILIDVDVSFHTSTGSIRLFIETSTDGNTWLSSLSQALTLPVSSTTDVTPMVTPTIIRSQYFRLAFFTGSTSDASVKINEIAGYKLIP